MYRKPTHTNDYTSSITATTLYLKKGLWCLHYFGDQFNFVVQILFKIKWKWPKKLIESLIANGFPKKLIEEAKKRMNIGPSYKTKMLSIMKKKLTKYNSAPYINGTSERINRTLRPHYFLLSIKSTNTIIWKHCHNIYHIYLSNFNSCFRRLNWFFFVISLMFSADEKSS